jgi:cobalt-zinc-cadmium efflux system protein
MGRDHSASAAGAHRGRLLVVFALTTAVLVAEVVGGLLSGSLACWPTPGTC